MMPARELDRPSFGDVFMNEYVKKVKELVLNCMMDEPVHIYLFGSWARGTARHGSDVDVAVEYPVGVSGALKIGELRERLEESTIPYRVDVVDMQRASQSLLEEIRKDGIRWK